MEEMFQNFWAPTWQILAASASLWKEASYHIRSRRTLRPSCYVEAKLAMWRGRVVENWETHKYMAPGELSKLAPSCMNHPRHHDTYTSHRHCDLWNGIHEEKVQPVHSWVSQTTHCVPIGAQGTTENSSLKVVVRFWLKQKDWKDEGVQRGPGPGLVRW